MKYKITKIDSKQIRLYVQEKRQDRYELLKEVW
jgi:hypothetical protein